MAFLNHVPNSKSFQNPMQPSHKSSALNNPFYASKNMVKYQKKQLEMRLLIDQVQDDNSKGLALIDTIQRLGLDHHFEDQISESLNQQYQYYSHTLLYDNYDLDTVSLRFRLLRQQGFHVPADVFNNFKGENMEFKDALSEDIRRMMALHEASHLCIEDEEILDEAVEHRAPQDRTPMTLKKLLSQDLK